MHPRGWFIHSISGYQTAYSQLAFAGKKEQDLLSESVPQLKMNLAKQLEKLTSTHPGKVTVLFSSWLYWLKASKAFVMVWFPSICLSFCMFVCVFLNYT